MKDIIFQIFELLKQSYTILLFGIITIVIAFGLLYPLWWFSIENPQTFTLTIFALLGVILFVLTIQKIRKEALIQGSSFLAIKYLFTRLALKLGSFFFHFLFLYLLALFFFNQYYPFFSLTLVLYLVLLVLKRKYIKKS